MYMHNFPLFEKGITLLHILYIDYMLISYRLSSNVNRHCGCAFAISLLKLACPHLILDHKFPSDQVHFLKA